MSKRNRNRPGRMLNREQREANRAAQQAAMGIVGRVALQAREDFDTLRANGFGASAIDSPAQLAELAGSILADDIDDVCATEVLLPAIRRQYERHTGRELTRAEIEQATDDQRDYDCAPDSEII